MCNVGSTASYRTGGQRDLREKVGEKGMPGQVKIWEPLKEAIKDCLALPTLP